MPPFPPPPKNSSHLDSLRIRDEQTYIYVTKRGLFIITDSRGEQISTGDDYDKTVLAADKQLRRAKAIRVAVHFLMPDRDDPEKLQLHIARGRHARTDAILAWEDDGTQEGKNYTLDYWRVKDVIRADTPKPPIARRARLVAIRRQLEERVERVNEKLREWDANYTFDLGRAVNDAIRETELERKRIDDDQNDFSLQYEEGDEPEGVT